MRFLIVGAGAIGGYFGGRLIEKGEDVTFLVRPNRKEQLKDSGLVVKSIHGDFQTDVKAVCAGEKAASFDVIILSVKAYHLNKVMEDIAPYIEKQTVILPLLNGYNHYEILQKAFGEEKILGGLCAVEATLNQAGEIVQTSKRNKLVFGEWNSSFSTRVQVMYEHFQGVKFNVHLSENIQRDVWDKYILISALSGITTLMRAPLGPILADQHGKEMLKGLIGEVVTIAKGFGAPVREDIDEHTLYILESLAPSMKSSMQRDMEKKRQVEVDHFHGFLLKIAKKQGRNIDSFPLLRMVYSNLNIYGRTVKPVSLPTKSFK